MNFARGFFRFAILGIGDRKKTEEPCCRVMNFRMKVLICEAVFQTGAIFLADHLKSESLNDESVTPVLSRIRDARFKRMIKPGDEVEISVKLGDKMGQFFTMTGEVRKEGKIALTLSYALAMVKEDSSK